MGVLVLNENIEIIQVIGIIVIVNGILCLTMFKQNSEKSSENVEEESEMIENKKK